MATEHFQLEFRNGRFPLRFIIAALTGLLLVWSTLKIVNWDSEINTEQLIAHVLLVAVFVLLSLSFLKFFSDIISQMRASLGLLLSWIIVLLIAGAIYLAGFLTIGQSGIDSILPYLRFVDMQAISLLFGGTVLASLPLFWIEKEVFSARAMVRASETAQFSNLGFRIRPHFLFNTLNSVAHLISMHPARAEKALYNLADVFRVVMADKRELVPLKAELELADKYLYLEKTRLGERLQVSSRIDPDSVGVMVPVLMLQPLLENAVYHGIETRFKGGTINISVQIIDNHLIIQITNPLPEGSIKRVGGNKVAQENLRDRIYQTFGSGGTFDAHEAEERYTVTIRLPL